MKKQLYRIVTGILAVAWMCLIFSFSNQPATESSKVSGGLCHRLVERANDTLHLDMTEKQQLTMAEKIEYPVRKAAHMTEYAILGLLSFAFYRGILKKEKRQFLAALLTAAVYAATDEFHQYFIPGRSAEVMDVCIDTLGASIGLAILFFTLKVVRKHCFPQSPHSILIFRVRHNLFDFYYELFETGQFLSYTHENFFYIFHEAFYFIPHPHENIFSGWSGIFIG